MQRVGAASLDEKSTSCNVDGHTHRFMADADSFNWAGFTGTGSIHFFIFAAHSTSSIWVSVQSLQYRVVGSSLYLFSYYMEFSILGSSGLVWEN